MWGVCAILLALGVGYSIYDYRVWRYQETVNYGHGPSDNQPREVKPDLVQVYKNDYLDLRLRLPETWVIKPEGQFVIDPLVTPQPKLAAGLILDKRMVAVRFADRITVAVQRTKLNLSDLVDRDAGSIKDRSYVNTNRVSFTLVTFTDRVVAYAKRDDIVYVFTWTGLGDGTFEEILKTVIIS